MQGRARHARRAAAALLAALAVSSFATNHLARAEGDGVVRGAANATATTISLQITAGSTGLGFTLGKSKADYRDVSAGAQGLALDMGLLEPILALPQCNGEFPPLLNTDTLPPKTVVDSFTDGAENSRVLEVRMPGTGKAPAGALVGTQDARAGEKPWSQALTTTVATDASLVGVFGGRTESTVEFVDGTRVAHAVSSANQVRIMGGMITFFKPRWEAEAKSGNEGRSNATFTFEHATVFGVPRSAAQIMADLTNFKYVIEKLLGALGVVFQIPEARPTPDGGIEITPMGFLIKDPPIGRQLIVPFLDSDAITQIEQTQISEDCRKETDWTLIGVLKQALGGEGQIQLLVGGAMAMTDATDYSFHPAPESPTTTVEETTTTTAVPTTEPVVEETTYDPGYQGSDDSSYDSSFESDLTTDTTPIDELALPVEQQATEPATKEKGTELDEIAAPSRKKSQPDSSAAAIAVGVVALMGAVGLSLGDRLVGRRAKRRIA
jgi:hypothetical protein